MAEARPTLDPAFAGVVAAFDGRPGVTPPGSGRGFGSAALKVDGRIFAMHVGGALVVKLPRERVAALVADGTGGPFVSGRGAAMREWLTVLADDEATRLALAEEALAFVRPRVRCRAR